MICSKTLARRADRKWLIIGPAEFELPAYHWQLEALAFFDHLVYGADNGYAAQPRVRYCTAGVGGLSRCAADWPLPGSEPLRLYPASNGADAVTHRLDRCAGRGRANRWAAMPLGAVVTPGFDEVANPDPELRTACR